MSRTPSILLAIGLLSLPATEALKAADPNPAEMRLREQLKNTMLQLRTVETERATLQAAKTESEQKNKELTAKVEAQAKQLVADKDAADKSLAALNLRLADQEAEVARLRASVEELQGAHKKASELASSKEAQRAKLAGEVIVLNRKVADQRTKNAAMFKLGNEILTRYEKFGLGDALTAREPFIGITRVKFENLIQDYGDKLVEQKIKP